jgi:hypothetical protein
MDGFAEFLQVVKRTQLAQGNFLGFLNVVIGRRIHTAQGAVVSTGVPWRVLAQELKKARWDKDAVRELGLDPKSLPPRDRERYWYAAIAQAQVGSAKAYEAGDRFAEALAQAGYVVGTPPQP